MIYTKFVMEWIYMATTMYMRPTHRKNSPPKLKEIYIYLNEKQKLKSKSTTFFGGVLTQIECLLPDIKIK